MRLQKVITFAYISCAYVSPSQSIEGNVLFAYLNCAVVFRVHISTLL